MSEHKSPEAHKSGSPVCFNCTTQLVRGNVWTDEINHKGEFVREPSVFRQRIAKDHPEGFTPARGRYHLYVSYACPWAHRALIARALKGLGDVIGVSVVHPILDGRGWHFKAEDDTFPGTVDHLYESELLRQLYDRSVASGTYAGRITVPVLWDREKKTIVNNESAEVLRILNGVFNDFAEYPEMDLYPADLAEQIDGVNEWVYKSINNGVYRCGFATKQAAYEEAFGELFDALERVEAILANTRYLTGDRLTEADIRLFTTLLRFDPVYHNHFKCNKWKVQERPVLWGFVRDVAQTPRVMDTIRLDHIKTHYYVSHTTINPSGIVPVGPDYDLHAPHDRATLAQSGTS